MQCTASPRAAGQHHHARSNLFSPPCMATHPTQPPSAPHKLAELDLAQEADALAVLARLVGQVGGLS